MSVQGGVRGAIYKRGGTATNSSGKTGRHSWNRVWLDGEWKYIDVTWDDCTNSMKYFLISYDEMAMNHNDGRGSADYNFLK